MLGTGSAISKSGIAAPFGLAMTNLEINTMRVLVVCSKYLPEYGGSGLRAHNTYKRLSQKYDVEFEVLSSSTVHNKSELYYHDGVKIYRVARKLFKNIHKLNLDKFGQRCLYVVAARINYLSETLPVFFYLLKNKDRFTLFHIFGKVNVTAAAATFAKIFKKPVIIELCTDMDDPHLYEPVLLERIYSSGFPKNSAIVCISKKLQELCRRFGYSGNVWCRPNPVDEERFFVDGTNKYKFRRQFSKFTKEDILLVDIAKFMPSKNQLFLLDVLRRLPEEYKLLLAGPLVESGPLRERDQNYFNSIKHKIQECGLEDRVQITPKFIEEADKYLKMADVFVFPTTSEGLGTPILEAQVCGVPVVVNQIAGVTDIWVKPGAGGYISALEPKIFAENVIKASKIKDDILQQNAKNILLLASSQSIDSHYLEIMKKLLRNKDIK